MVSAHCESRMQSHILEKKNIFPVCSHKRTKQVLSIL